METNINMKLFVWSGMIAVLLVLGLVVEMEPVYKYILAGATLIIGFGLMAASKRKQSSGK
jgi:hypothetical protein